MILTWLSLSMVRSMGIEVGMGNVVSRDDQGLGYDVEDRSADAVHRVEVKGSQSKDIRLLLTAHEHHVAHQDSGSYEAHF